MPKTARKRRFDNAPVVRSHIFVAHTPGLDQPRVDARDDSGRQNVEYEDRTIVPNQMPPQSDVPNLMRHTDLTPWNLLI